ncbi:hypothetical protein G6011_03933 [Alternaria panax]|uniref:Uncharacterized protein n=1 Tax=Alternaria panax TaxID=48097 RepID=A0AAD4NTI9_9PLEO|nr:hypothetical protein G6011_03933 [Alternaria panax]
MVSDNPLFPSPVKRWYNKAQPAGDPGLPTLSQKGRSILVTSGDNTSIGGETACFFARAGATRIGLLERHEGPLLENKAAIEKESAGMFVFIQSTDMTDEAADGKIDTLIHTAGAIGSKENFAYVDGCEFLEGITENIEGSLCVAKAFLRTAAPGGYVIAINSWVYRLWDNVLLARPNLIGGADSFKDVKTDNVTLPASFNLWLSTPEARFLKGKFWWCNCDIDELKSRAKEIESGRLLNIDLVGWPFYSFAK